jgi:hypothetical protein
MTPDMTIGRRALRQAKQHAAELEKKAKELKKTVAENTEPSLESPHRPKGN